MSIDYFEDIFSPAITMKVVVLNETSTNNTAREDPEGNTTDVTPLAIFDGLPIRGGERCKIKILANSQSNIPLDFSTKTADYLYVTSITNVLRDSKREMFTLHLTSREAFTNETSRCYKKYSPDQNIGTTVENILKDTLKVEEDRFKVEPTSNAYGFIGNLRKPFPVITWLAKKSISNSAQGKSSGFLFYQTKTGFKFRSVDTLMRQEYYKLTNDDGEKAESPPFFYSEATIAYDENENPVTLLNDFKILKFSIQKSNDIVKNLTGYNPSSNQIYTNETIFFDEPLNDWDNYYFNVHRDMGYNFIVYLNKDSEECGTNLYDYDQYDSLTNLLHYGEEHVHPWVAKSKIARMAHLKGIYNRMVLFDGKLFPHGMNIIKNKFTNKYRQNITSFYE